MQQNNSFDISDANSIYEYAKKLIGKCLRDIIDSEVDIKRNTGKGELGQLVERLYFKYECNAKQAPDFEEAKVELKTTPLKRNNKGVLTIKERLVCGMIDYNKECNLSFEESSFYKKCTLLLLLFYIHNSEASNIDLIFKYVTLWRIPDKDLLIMKSDFEILKKKIRDGKAHEISEGDTLYLGACTKGTVTSFVEQPYSEEKARKRAFSLKTTYMRCILNYIQESQEPIPSVIKYENLETESFENIIKNKFIPYIGKSEKELFSEFNLPETNAKQKWQILVNTILGAPGAKKIEEFEKADITLKVFRISNNNKCKEHMSFPNINYTSIINEDEWEESSLYNLFSKKFLFVIFKQDKYDKKTFYLYNILFWTMPKKDLDVASIYWEHIKKKVLENDFTHFISIKDDLKFHVRPKGRKAVDTATNHNGGFAPKKGYWINKNYLEEILKENGVI